VGHEDGRANEAGSEVKAVEGLAATAAAICNGEDAGPRDRAPSETFAEWHEQKSTKLMQQCLPLAQPRRRLYVVGWRSPVFQTNREPHPLLNQRNLCLSAPSARTVNACRRNRWAAAAPEGEGHWQTPVTWVVQALGRRRPVAGSILRVLPPYRCSAGWRESQREQEGEARYMAWSDRLSAMR